MLLALNSKEVLARYKRGTDALLISADPFSVTTLPFTWGTSVRLRRTHLHQATTICTSSPQLRVAPENSKARHFGTSLARDRLTWHGSRRAGFDAGFGPNLLSLSSGTPVRLCLLVAGPAASLRILLAMTCDEHPSPVFKVFSAVLLILDRTICGLELDSNKVQRG